jgi:hypothetical protein
MHLHEHNQAPIHQAMVQHVVMTWGVLAVWQINAVAFRKQLSRRFIWRRGTRRDRAAPSRVDPVRSGMAKLGAIGPVAPE